ncbi:outer membrane lipoprotein-sorting protein [Ramlibacter sp.]|uniref:outer membrane lipoprotein-sorting protein n=1 Tax=Ramlibacter sp. TaxID=1917967 RepID=UPI00179D1E27|nr:outer membrane lipoprotein-sorting protein [Ramlibacter sp.]MBA2676524.1 outer membrane lipoprotein-sorting protein [Ramlibacter sp.]
MTTNRWVAAAALAIATTLPAFALEQDVGALLKAADRYRVASQNTRVDTQVSVLNADGSVDKERLYTVFAQTNHQSLVLMQSPAEKGQKVLMSGDDFWLVLPGSQRPLRITPMQKLLGDASTADIAAMSWADDYTGTVAAEERCGEPARDCLHLTLQATRKAVTYQRIELWIGKARREPVKAELYVQSDKLAKRAQFVLDGANPNIVSAMLLQDQIANHKQTQVRYLDRKPHTVPETWLNPMYLVRNTSLE